MTVQNIGIAFINQLVDYNTTETFIKVNSAEFPRKIKYKKKKERQECNKKSILLYRSGKITRVIL